MVGKKVILGTLGLLFWISCAGSDSTDDPEERLLEYLVTNTSYNKNVRPGFVKNDIKLPISINISFAPYRLLEVDDHQETMTLLVLITESWFDQRLTWNPKDFGGKKKLKTTPDTLWTPLTYMPNLDTINPGDKAFQFDLTVTIKDETTSAAHVAMTTIATIQENCEFEMTYFPFDTQTCKMCLEGTQYDLDELTYSPQSMNLTAFLNGGEWDLGDVTIFSGQFFNTSSACIQISAQRRSLYYVVNLFLPTITICVLNTLSLFASINADQNELDFASLGQTTLLSLGVLLLTVADQTPKGAGEVSLLGVFFLAMIFQTLLAAVMAVYLRKWYRRHHQQLKRIGFYPKLPSPITKHPIFEYIKKNAVNICLVVNLAVIMLLSIITVAVGYSNKSGIFV